MKLEELIKQRERHNPEKRAKIEQLCSLNEALKEATLALVKSYAEAGSIAADFGEQKKIMDDLFRKHKEVLQKEGIFNLDDLLESSFQQADEVAEYKKRKTSLRPSLKSKISGAREAKKVISKELGLDKTEVQTSNVPFFIGDDSEEGEVGSREEKVKALIEKVNQKIKALEDEIKVLESE